MSGARRKNHNLVEKSSVNQFSTTTKSILQSNVARDISKAVYGGDVILSYLILRCFKDYLIYSFLCLFDTLKEDTKEKKSTVNERMNQ